MVIIFLVVPHPGNQVGPVTTSMYSCHTHELCPSILPWRVEHRKRQSHCLPFPILASHACESYFKNEHTSTLTNVYEKAWNWGTGVSTCTFHNLLYTRSAQAHAHTHKAPLASESAADIKTGGPSLAVFSKPVSHTCNSSLKQSANSTGCKH